MNRRDSRARAERAQRLRAIGRTWQEVADLEGFRSRRSAQRAVAQLCSAEPAEGVEVSRRTAAESLRITTAILFERFAAAVDRQDDQTVALLNRELVRNRHQHAQLLGLYAPERARLDVTVTSVEDTRSRLLALLERDTPALPVVDAQVEEVTS